MMNAIAFLIPILDKWLWYAPLHKTAALINNSAAKLLRNAHNDRPTGELGELSDLLHTTPTYVPHPIEGDLVPSTLGIIPTRGCNMNCLYCNFGGASIQPDIMAPDLAIAAVDWAANKKTQAQQDSLHIQFFGGEPFTARELVETVVHRANYIAKQKNLIPYFDASTNGMFGKQQCQFIGDHFNAIILSLDGPPKFQNKYRPTSKQGHPSSPIVERNAHALSEMELELCLRICITHESVPHMERIAKWMIKNFNPAVINFETLTPGELAKQSGLKPPDPYQFAINALKVYQLAADCGIEAVHAAIETSTPRLSLCPVGKDTVIVSPDGRLSACYLMPTEWQRLGLNLDFGHLYSAANVNIVHDALIEVRNLPANKVRCNNCFCQYTCAGGCHVNQASLKPGTYNDFCIQTRLITASLLIQDIGFTHIQQELLQNHKAMESLVLNPCDVYAHNHY